MKNRIELRNRIESLKNKYESRLAKARSDTIGTVTPEIEFIEGRLMDLDKLIQTGWGDLSRKTLEKLEKWVEEDRKDH